MRPQNLKTKIFLDSGDPVETREALALLGFLDGQTTNPSLVTKNPDAQKRILDGKKFTRQEIHDFYKEIVTEVSSLIPNGSVSIEVYADSNTTAREHIMEAEEKFTWIPNAHIKFPITKAGLTATEQVVRSGMRVNLTLNFSQEQAAGVYAATKGAKKGDVFISPFIGRLDDIGQSGMDIIKNIVEMYKASDGHVEALAASIRSLDHFLNSIALGADIITAPLHIIKVWAQAGMPAPESITSVPISLQPIPYQDISLEKPWQEYGIQHDLTDKRLLKIP